MQTQRTKFYESQRLSPLWESWKTFLCDLCLATQLEQACHWLAYIFQYDSVLFITVTACLGPFCKDRIDNELNIYGKLLIMTSQNGELWLTYPSFEIFL